MEPRKTPNSQNNSEKENKAEGIILPDFKLWDKCIVTKTIWYCHKTRHIDQWNRIKKPETNQCTYVQLIFNQASLEDQ